MADDLVSKLGETRALRHEVTGDAGFAVDSVRCEIYDSAGNHVVVAGVGVANSLAADDTRWEIYYLWTPEEESS